MKLYELAQEEKQLQDLFLMSIDEETGEIKNPETLEELERELKNALTTKSTGIIKAIREQEIDINMTDAEMKEVEKEIERLKAVKSRKEKSLENFKNYIKRNMIQMEIKKIETPLGNLSVRQNPVSTDVYDKNLIPKEFMKPKTTYSISLTDIKKAIEAGTEVPGARLVTKTNLIVK